MELVGLEWLGIEFDIVKNTSDDMEVFYEKGMELIKSGKAYICMLFFLVYFY